MQIEVIEFARNVAGLEMANSTEFEQDTPHPVIDIMPDQVGVDMGGTMRLGHWPRQIVPGTLAEEVYGSGLVHERHRHRYEVNNAYRDALADAGMVFSGTSPDGTLVEIAEIGDHPFYIGSQFHPSSRAALEAPPAVLRLCWRLRRDSETNGRTEYRASEAEQGATC